MNRNLSLIITWSGKFIIVLTSLLFFIGGMVHAQGDYISNDEGITWLLNQGAYAYDSSFTQENPNNVASYIKILDFVDPQYPRYPYPIVFGDGDHDGKIEMFRAIYVSSNNKFMRVYEFDIDLSYTTTDIQYYGIPWAIGDIDGNGKTDLVIQSGDPGLYGNGYLRVYESPDAFTYPSVLKSEITLPDRKIEYRAKIVDTDSDGKKEVLLSANGFSASDLRIYEWESGSLQLKWTAPEITVSTLTKAVADFDGDLQIEIGTVASTTAYVYESTSNDTYVFRQSWSLPYWGDAVDATNPDGGNPEFAVGMNYDIGGGRSQYKWIFYKETNNTFNQWWETSFSSNVWYSNPRHATGDYDKDGFDEVVVDDHPVLKILEYVDGQMQVTWTSTEPDPIYLTSCDMRNDNFMNFAVVNFNPSEDILSFFEEERLANAYLNLSLDNSATAHNNNHVIERGYYGKLHEVFASGGEIFYRRSSNNGTNWELTTRISNANDFNNHPSIVAAGLGAKDFLCLVWQRKLTNYQYEIYTVFSSNSGTTWSEPSDPISVTVSYSQSNENWGPGTTPVVASYQSGGQKYLLVYATESGLYYRTATFGSDWSAATVIPGSYGLGSTIWYPSVATYNNQSTQVNLIYDDRFTHVYSQIFNGTSWANRVVADWTGSYNRTSSIAVDYANSTLGVWSGWNGNNFTIRFRQGYSDGTWSRWYKEWSISGVNSICPAVTYYKKDLPYPYGIDILWFTESPSQEIRQKTYSGLGDNWIPADPNTQLIATSGLFANLTHERENTIKPIQIWTDQSEEPYSILYNSDYLPKGDLLVGGEIHRAAEITNDTDNSHLRVELSEPVITLTNGEIIKIPFKTYNYLDSLELSTENVFDYLQTEFVNIPNNADEITFKVDINASQPDTLSDGTLNNNNQTPFRMINFELLARDDSSHILLNNIGNHLLNNLSGIHHYSREFTFNAFVLRGKNLSMLPNINLSGTFNQSNLYFTLVNVSIEGDGIGKDSPETDNITPTEFSLYQNYPNPFNPVTTISYNIVEVQDVKLTVYDVLGREVVTLVNEQQQPGSYHVRWIASNAASGIYFYQLKTGNFVDTKKMILLK